jgi:hypothetical protein
MGMTLTEKLAETARTWDQVAAESRRAAEEHDRRAAAILAEQFKPSPLERHDVSTEAARESFENDRRMRAFVPRQDAAQARARAEHFATKARVARDQGLLYHDTRVGSFDEDVTGDYGLLFKEAIAAKRVEWARDVNPTPGPAPAAV